MFKMVKRATASVETMVTAVWSRSGSVPVPYRPLMDADSPLPSTDTNSLIRRTVRSKLSKRRDVWHPNVYAVAEALFQNLLNPQFLQESGFVKKENRVVISEFMAAWNMTPSQTVPINEETVDELENLFSAMMTGIRPADEPANDNEPFFKLLKWDMVSLSPSQSSLSFVMQDLDGASKPASEIIQIDTLVQELSGLYDEWIKNYESKKKRPLVFVRKANLILNRYFVELLKINRDETPVAASHWATTEIQAALNYYFDQREKLFRIYSSTAAIPWSTEQIERKISQMHPRVRYLKEMFARTEEYSSKIELGMFQIRFGFDRMTKINAALEKYHSICALPFDHHKQMDPRIHAQIEAALHNGRLAKLS